MEVSQLRQGANNSRVILAFDGQAMSDVLFFPDELAAHVAGGKANNLIDRVGVEALAGMNFSLRFYDAKIKDIGQTVKNRLLEYRTHADIVTVHADMKPESLRTAAKTAEVCGFACVGVPVLTDMTSEECYETYRRTPEEAAHDFTIRAREAGLHGIVCSPHETKMVRRLFPDGLIINPVVRLADSDSHDQSRVGTPDQAIRDGADLLVVGPDILGEETKSERLRKLLRYNTAVNDALALG